MIDIIEAESDFVDATNEIDNKNEFENDGEDRNANDSVNKTFSNPSQADILSSESIFKCLQCDFKTPTKVYTKEKVIIGAHFVSLYSTARKH